MAQRIGIMFEFGGTSELIENRKVGVVHPTTSNSEATNYTEWFKNNYESVRDWLGQKYGYVVHLVYEPFGYEGPSRGAHNFLGRLDCLEDTRLSHLTDFYSGFLTPCVADSSVLRHLILEMGALGIDTYEIEPTGDEGGVPGNESRLLSRWEKLKDESYSALVTALNDELTLLKDSGLTNLAFNGMETKADQSIERQFASFWENTIEARRTWVGGAYQLDDGWATSPCVVGWAEFKEKFIDSHNPATHPDYTDATAFNNHYGDLNSYAMVVRISKDDYPDGETPETEGTLAWVQQKARLTSDAFDLFNSSTNVCFAISHVIIKAALEHSIANGSFT